MSRSLAITGLCAVLVSPSLAAAISGVCPDGSIFIVQDASAIPCREAKRVEASDVPPIQPKLLPRPYGWERFHRRSDPNNPYNVVDADRAGDLPPAPVREEAALATEPPRTPSLDSPQPALQALAPTTQSAEAPWIPSTAPRAFDLALSPQEVADLHEIVALRQSVAPARLTRFGRGGDREMTLEVARSPSFEGRLHQVLRERAQGSVGPVLLFRVESKIEDAFHGNLTFVQGHIAFHPDLENPGQFGLIDGALGPHEPGQQTLGYAVLPEHLDAAAPLDIYWNDRRITATLLP